MSKRLRDMIREIRQARTAAAERDMVAKESAAIRDSFNSAENKYRQRNLTKCLFIHMLGYPTSFAQMEPIKLLSSQYPYVRKKAALCAIRIIRKVPELLEYFVPKIRALLSEKHHGVLITTVTLLIEMCKVEPTTVPAVDRQGAGAAGVLCTQDPGAAV